MLFLLIPMNCSEIIVNNANNNAASEDEFDYTIPDSRENDDFGPSHLTEESLLELQYDQFSLHKTSSSSMIGELLEFKRSSSFKSLTGDDSKPPSKVSSSFALQITNDTANTESVSLTSSSGGAESSRPSAPIIPESTRLIFENDAIMTEVIAFLEPEDLNAISATGIDIFDVFVKKRFAKKYPLLDSISNSPSFLIELELGLSNMPTKCLITDSDSIHHTTPISRLIFCIRRILSESQALSERYRLANLIELIKSQGKDIIDYPKKFAFPTPLQVLFPEIGHFDDLTVLNRETLISIVMLACNEGHLRLMKALVQDIKNQFPRTAASIVLECFILAKEKRNGIDWSPLQRTVHSNSLALAQYIFYDLTAEKAVLEAFRAHIFATKNAEIATQLPSMLELLLFPTISDSKTAQLLRQTILNAFAIGKLRTIHIIACKASGAQFLTQFLNWHRQINGPLSSQDLFLLLDARFASKSQHSLLKIVKKFIEADDVDKKFRFPLSLAIKYDHPQALMTFLEPEYNYALLRERLLGGSLDTLFGTIVKYNAHKFLNFLLENVFMIVDFSSMLPFPVKDAIEAESWDVLKIFFKIDWQGLKLLSQDEKIQILKTNPEFLELIFENDLVQIETFASSFMGESDHHVTVLEWIILSGSEPAFNWFYKLKSSDRFWKKYDGAGYAPIHLAIIVGNLNFISKLLLIDPSMAVHLSYFGETPKDLAMRLRDKTVNLDKISVLENIIEILAK